MTLYYPRILFTLFGFLSIEIEVFAIVYQLHFDTSALEGRNSWDYRFVNQKIDSTNILMNCSDVFFIIILILLLQLLCFLLTRCYKKIPEDEE
jgi:hypothetical protein